MAEVAYYDGDNQEINRIWVRPKQKQTALDVPSNCSKIIIDPDQYMPDVNRTNNSTNKKLKNCLTVEIFLDIVDCSNDCFLNNSIQDIIL